MNRTNKAKYSWHQKKHTRLYYDLFEEGREGEVKRTKSGISGSA